MSPAVLAGETEAAHVMYRLFVETPQNRPLLVVRAPDDGGPKPMVTPPHESVSPITLFVRCASVRTHMCITQWTGDRIALPQADSS